MLQVDAVAQTLLVARTLQHPKVVACRWSDHDALHYYVAPRQRSSCTLAPCMDCPLAARAELGDTPWGYDAPRHDTAVSDRRIDAARLDRDGIGVR